MKKVIVAYIPVIHQGVIDFLLRNIDRNLVLILGSDILENLSDGDDGVKALKRDPRVIKERLIVDLLESINKNFTARVLRFDNIEYLNNYQQVIVPDEDVTRLFASRFLVSDKGFNGEIKFEQTFLRWDMPKTLSVVPPNCDEYINWNDLEKMGLDSHILKAMTVSEYSSDWWRQVGGVMVRDKRVIYSAYNHHVPTEYQNYILGDPRSNFDAGQCIELSTADHAESSIIALAARNGVSTKGADLFVTTFPCPPCAKLIAGAGFGRLFFLDGYSKVESVEILKSAGVKIIHIQK